MSSFINPKSQAVGADGSASAPSYTFINDADTGLYREGSGQIAFTSNGVKVAELDTNLTLTNAIKVPSGNASTPSLTFDGESNTGFFKKANAQIGISVSGTEIGYFSSAGLGGSILPASTFGAGSEASPSIAFTADPNTGFYNSNADEISCSCNGTRQWKTSKFQTIYYNQVLLPDGNTSIPALAFNSDTLTGLYYLGPSNMGVVVGGSKQIDLSASNATFTNKIIAPSYGLTGDNNTYITQDVGDTFAFYCGGTKSSVINTNGIQVGNGTVSQPSMSFQSDSGSGLYRIGASNIGVACNGVKQVDISTSGITFTQPIQPYTETTVTTACSGATTGNMTLYFVKVGNIVNVKSTGDFAWSGGSSATLINANTGLANRFKPSATVNFLIVAENNSVQTVCSAKIDTAGQITIYAGLGGLWSTGSNNIFPLNFTFSTTNT